MKQRSWLRQHWKLAVNLLTVLALVVLVVAIRHQLIDTFKNLHHVRIWILLLLLPIEALNYHAQAKLYQKLFAVVGNRVAYKFLYLASLELNFVNHVFPSGGVTGISYFTLRLRKGKEISSGKATLIHIMKLALYMVSFELVLVFGVFALAIMGHASNLVVLVASSLSTLLLVGTAVFVYIVGSRERINSFFVGATRAVNWFIHLIRPKSPETINIEGVRGLFTDFHENYQLLWNSRRQLKAPFWYALLANVTEVAAVYVVYVAFGELVNVGAVILAYAIANFAGLVSVLPGGVGIYEGLMTAVLAATGIPARVSLPITIMYRVLNTLIQIPPGYYLYQKALRRRSEPSPETLDGS
jgi:putative heme transporter